VEEALESVRKMCEIVVWVVDQAHVNNDDDCCCMEWKDDAMEQWIHDTRKTTRLITYYWEREKDVRVGGERREEGHDTLYSV